MRHALSIVLLIWTTLATALPLETIKLPPGFAIELWARVDNARQMALGAIDARGGVLYVGSRGAGTVHAVRFDAAYRAGAVIRVAAGLNMPSGLAWRHGALYVGAVNRILRYDDIDNRLDNPPAPVVVTDSLPRDTHHGWKFIAFGPDGKLYVPVGAPCNICEPGDPYAACCA
jgi:glucose/arabinose dehydrogenase